jgi:putative membrane protein
MLRATGWRVLTTATFAVVALSCARPLRGPRTATSAPAAPARSPVTVRREQPSDPNVAAILLAANNTDVSYAKVALAPGHTENAAVKAFAQRMLTDHTSVNQLLTDLFAKADLTPEDNTTSLDFRDESATKRDILRELSGHAFDTTYMANEVSYHTKLLSALDALTPGVRRVPLKQLMTAIRPTVAAHLAHAQQLRATVTGAAK